MKKSMLWRGMILLLAVTPVMAVTQPIGTTNQCWDFDQDIQFGVLPTDGGAGNSFGTPVAIIQDMSGQGVSWDNGVWSGSEFKIILDIPNQPIANPYKSLTINIKYRGEVSFSWVADAVTGDHFTLIEEQPGQDETWQTLTQQWRFEPNPREEIVVIGFKGITAAAELDQICIDTICVPEPATLSIFAIGAGLMLRRKHK